MKRTFLIAFLAVLLTGSSDLLGYTVYSDMAGSASMRIYGYSYTDLAGSDWHYSANTIFQRMFDPNGVETNAYGGGTYASMSVPYAGDGQYNILARHELTCRLYGIPVTPFSSGWVGISISYGVYQLENPGGIISSYLACPNYNVKCIVMYVHQSQLPEGVAPWPSYLGLLTLNASAFPVGTVCFIIESHPASSCGG